MAEFVNEPELCKRLIDYVVVVGVRSPTLGLTETPDTLRKFPNQDHDDFSFPPDVVFFCQPEGCSTVTKKISLRQATSFIFTLTDKESGKTRYGVSMNFYRPCFTAATLPEANGRTKEYDSKTTKQRTSTRCMSLTSLCILSHHPFHSSFRECMHTLRRMIEYKAGVNSTQTSSKQTSQMLDCWSLFLCTEDPKLSPLQDDMREIESWIQRLLLTPVPIPGRTEVELELLPQDLHTPISFAFPDVKRFSLVDFPIHLPLELLGVDTFLKVLTCILLEQKVVFQSRDYNALTMTILAMSSLLYPLEYMFPIIPLLPSCMNNAEQLLLAPTPYIIGVPASFFKYKNSDFSNPQDLWIVDLDSNKITVPFQADELPELPEPEVSILTGNLKRALASLSVPPQTIPTFDGQGSLVNGTNDEIKVPLGLTSNQVVYGNDVDTVDVGVRVAMTSFFLAQNVLGSLHEHTRILRLFPRPVVAVQKDAFLQSLPGVSKFVMALADTQNVEYFAEWLVYPNNIAYTRIQMGITDPHLVGDKPRWYNYKLDKLNFKAYDPEWSICNDEWLEYEADLLNEIYESDESERHTSIEDDDSSSCYSSVSDTVAEMFRGDIHGETPSGPNLPPYTPPYVSSPAPNCNANLQNAVNCWNNEDEMTAKERMFSTDSYSLEGVEEEDEEEVYSVSNPPSPSTDSRRTSSSVSSTISDPVAKSDMTSQSVNGSSGSFHNSDPAKPRVLRSNELPRSRNSISLDTKLASLQANSLFKPISKEGKPITSEDQQFLHEIVTSVLNANGVGMFKKKRLRDLMVNEICRQKVINKLLFEMSDDKKNDVVCDVNITKGVLRGMLEILRNVVSGLQVSISSFGLGRVTSAYHFLRIAHTYYYGREIKDWDGDEDHSKVSPAESISNLSDISDTTVSISSMNESGDRSTLVNSDSDLDSGHCEASELGSEIDSVMAPQFRANYGDHHPPTPAKVTLSRTRSCIATTTEDDPDVERQSITRTMSNLETQLKVPVTKDVAKVTGASPRLAHMKMTSQKPDGAGNACVFLPNLSNLTRKSDLSKGYRFNSGELIDVGDGTYRRPGTSTGRKYLFEGLLGDRATVWDNMEFWEYLFMDVVAAERDALGMNQNFGEMIERYRSLGKLEQKRLEEDEDKVLGSTLFNLTAFMVALNVDVEEMRRKIRRIIGKAHIGMHQSQLIGRLLSKLEYLGGNDIDLRPDCSQQMTKKTFVVHCGSNLIGDVYFMEVYDDCILLRAPSGTILERWWYEKLVNITYSPKTKMLCLWYRTGQDTQLNKFCTKKCKALYFCIKETMQRAADRLQGLKGGPQLGGKFPAQDIENGQVGILEVSLDGIIVKFKNKKTHLHLNCIKNCSTQKGILIIDEFDPVTQEEIQHQFKSSMASDICYAVLCLFSYAAASKGLQVRS